MNRRRQRLQIAPAVPRLACRQLAVCCVRKRPSEERRLHAVVLTPHNTAPREGESVAEMGRERLWYWAVTGLVLRQAVLVDPQPTAAELEADVAEGQPGHIPTDHRSLKAHDCRRERRLQRRSPATRSWRQTALHLATGCPVHTLVHDLRVSSPAKRGPHQTKGNDRAVRTMVRGGRQRRAWLLTRAARSSLHDPHRTGPVRGR